MSRPFVYTGTSIFISLVIFSYCDFMSVAAVFGVSLLLVLPMFLLRKKNRIFLIIFTCLLSLMFSSCAFAIKTATEYIPAQNVCTDYPIKVSGTLTDYSNEYGNNYYYLKDIFIDDSPTNLKIRINAKYRVFAEVDDTLTFSVNEIRTKSHDKSAMHYKAEGIYITAYSKSRITVTEATEHSINYHLSSVRTFISERLEENLNSRYVPTVDAMITGNKSEIDSRTDHSFSQAGISHLFAVSGFHLTFWTSALYILLKQTPLRNKRKLRAVISICFIIFFMALTGFTPSVIRAGIMQIIMFSAFFSKYKPDPLNSLFAAVTILLIINPFAAMSMSLQMSFFATLGIITLSAPITDTVEKINTAVKTKPIAKALSYTYSVAMISVVATLFTIFISAINFSEYSVAAPLTNILCIPVAQLVMPFGILCVIFSFIPAISHPMSIICNIIMSYIYRVCEVVSENPHSVVDASSQGIIIPVIVITVFLIFALVFFYEKNKKLHLCLIIAVTCITAVSVASEIDTAYTHKITVADTGNGTTILYSSGDRNIIIGCGGNDYSSYKAENLLTSVNAGTHDLLIVPRNTETEASYTADFLRLGKYKHIIMSEEFRNRSFSMLNNENTVFTDESNIIIDEKTNLMYINNSKFSGVRIEAPDFSCTVIFKSASDFSAVPDSWSQGDLLITRNKLPDTDISGFGNIFISTDLEYTYESPSILTTKHSGQLIYRTSLIGENRIYADK